jgi:hypothetical protein
MRTIVSICSGVSRNNRFRRTDSTCIGRGIQLLPAKLGEHDENIVPVRATTLNERSFTYSRQLMGKAAFVPTHHRGQRLLPHLALFQ